MTDSSQTRPNVLLIMADHWFGSLLGCAGHPAVQTPTLDEIARCGTRFTNAYSEYPVCLPARRTLMLGVTARTHGDRTFQPQLPMPDDIPTLAQTFRDSGYQANAVGKIHVYPQRDRIGFDDVILDDEGRNMFGVTDDYDIFLGDMGYAGQQYLHGMSNNEYSFRPWHLPEELHVTNWASRMMTRAIKRRDPTKPSFWYLGYRHPHPPLVPLQCYLDLYNDVPIDEPRIADWAKDTGSLPYTAQAHQVRSFKYDAQQVLAARRAFYALCTHIDHQIRTVIGTLREEGILDDTIVLFTSDHGEMLGNHRMWAKRVFYENSSKIPMILMGTRSKGDVPHHNEDDRLTGLQDVMPTLLELCGIPVPGTVEGVSMLGNKKHEFLLGEDGEDEHSSRMIHDGRHKLIYYPVGNRVQLFDIADDPHEMTDRFDDRAYRSVQARLIERLVSEMYGSDEKWITDGKITGEPGRDFQSGPNPSLYAQRGDQWPTPPITDKAAMEWYPEARIDD